ncbi:hypothetical protein H2201_001572 [Coniosporium apollinis]|uniref:Uncharacterized protein n=1 Tax=Coniosporium apollinis TaxID=61459 RepID=A0ABQ9P1K2_9PEZI|nr:hypothetical protein H2201_001572 [Coniosporium apollinis]
MEEHLAVLRRLESLEHELENMRRQRDQDLSLLKQSEVGVYENMRKMKLLLDDKVEAVVDRLHALGNLEKRVVTIDESQIQLESRFDEFERSRRFQSPSITPMQEATITQTIDEQPVRLEKQMYSFSWSVRVILVPQKTQRFAFDYDSVANKRCQSRNFQQDITFFDRECESFIRAVEIAYCSVLHGRSWVPLAGHRSTEPQHFGRMELKQLADEYCSTSLWNHSFLDHHCVAHDKLAGDVLYIALQNENLTWEEIRQLPTLYGSDESCWAHDEELDGKMRSFSNGMDTKMTYSYLDPPPSYTGAHSDIDRLPSSLDVLATASASYHPLDALRHPSTYSGSTLIAPDQATLSDQSGMSVRSFNTEISDDEHVGKKPKLRTKASAPAMRPSTASSSGSQTVYVSGRSKRKMTVREKDKQPGRSFADWKAPKINSLLHRHDAKDKSAEAS